jgi:hypothetical protein
MALLCHTHSQRATATALLCHTHRQRAPATALLCHTHRQRDTDCRGIYFACTSQLRCVYALPTRSCRQSDHKRPPYCCALCFALCVLANADRQAPRHPPRRRKPEQEALLAEEPHPARRRAEQPQRQGDTWRRKLARGAEHNFQNVAEGVVEWW